MKKTFMHPIVAAGLTSILAFGAVGCSASSSSTTTTEVTTTDENGNTTTETTTTTTDENGNTTTESSTTNSVDPDSWTGYSNDYYKVGLAIPDGFERVESTEDTDEGMSVDYEIANADETARATIYLVKGVTEQEGVNDGETWAQAYADAAAEAIEEAGGQMDVNVANFTIGGIDYGECAIMSGTVNDQPYFTDLYFILDEDGDGMLIQFNAQNEDDIQTLRDHLLALTDDSADSADTEDATQSE